MSNKTFKPLIYLFLTIFLTVVTFDMIKTIPKTHGAAPPVVADILLKTYTLSDLKKYDGSNPDLPIYLAYDGNVYDITAGKQFYQTGAVYHFLAGKDSTAELNFAGGGIIKKKYPMVGKLIP